MRSRYKSGHDGRTWGGSDESGGYWCYASNDNTTTISTNIRMMIIIITIIITLQLPKGVSGYFWTGFSDNHCPMVHNPIVTFYYNTTTKSYQQLQPDERTNITMTFQNTTKTSRKSSNNDNSNNNNNRHDFIRRHRKLNADDNIMYTTLKSDTSNTINEDEYVEHYWDTINGTTIKFSSTIQVRECTCASNNSKTTSHHPNQYNYKDKYYCLSKFDYCYVPTYNVYNVFYVPTCYNQSILVKISAAIWRPVVLLYGCIIIILLITPRGHKIFGGCCSFVLSPFGCSNNWIIDYLVRTKPLFIHQLLLQHRRYLQQHPFEQQQQQTTNNSNERSYSNYFQRIIPEGIRQIFVRHTTTQPVTNTTVDVPTPTTTSEVILSNNITSNTDQHEQQQQQQQQQQLVNNNDNTPNPLVLLDHIIDEYERNNENTVPNSSRSRYDRSRRPSPSYRRRPWKPYPNKHKLEHEIRIKRYQPNTQQQQQRIHDISLSSSRDDACPTTSIEEQKVRTRQSSSPTTTINDDNLVSISDNGLVVTDVSTYNYDDENDEDIDNNDNYITNDIDDSEKEDGGLSSSSTQQRCQPRRAMCSICYLKIIPGMKIGDLSCHHLFHIDCLKTWVQRRNVCPLCLQSNVAIPKKEQLLQLQQQYQQQQVSANYNNNEYERYDNDPPMALRWQFEYR